MDDMVSATYDRFFSPQLFMIDNNTERAYSWEYNLEMNETLEWVQNKTYLNSETQFQVPRILPWQFYKWYNRRMLYQIKYTMMFGNTVNRILSKLPKGLTSAPPISFIYDHDGTDIFKKKARNQFYCAILVALITMNIFLQIFRKMFCKKVIVVRKKKNVDKDD